MDGPIFTTETIIQFARPENASSRIYLLIQTEYKQMRRQSLADVASTRSARYQFSLRTLLISICIICIWIGWLSESARNQRLATHSILRERGIVKYDYELRGANAPPGPPWLRRRLGDDYFCTAIEVTFNLQPWTVTDDGLKHICRLPHLKSLELQRTQVTDVGLAKLRELTSLRSLNLERTPITGAALSTSPACANWNGFLSEDAA